MKSKRIKASNLPTHSPLIGTIVFYLLLDKFSAPGWLWGVVGTLFAVLWIAFFIGVFSSEYVDIFEKQDRSSR